MNTPNARIGLACVCLMMVQADYGWTQTAKPPASREVIFQEDFADPTLPAWSNPRAARAANPVFTREQGPDAKAAVSLEARSPISLTRSVSLPVKRIAGKAVLLEVWRKAENVKTGTRAYYNAKSMLSWKATGAGKPDYSTTLHSDFHGNSDWHRHMYVVRMPKELQWARVTIGMQNCSGKASWAGLSVSVDPRFPSQEALKRFLTRQQRELFANLDEEALTIRHLDGGIIQVFAGRTYVPRPYWNATVRKAVLQSSERYRGDRPKCDSGGFNASLAVALSDRAGELQDGLKELSGAALNDRLYEVASLRRRVHELVGPKCHAKAVRIVAEAAATIPVSLLVFGNNINAQNLIGPYDFARGSFQDGFLQRVRPMGIALLRYPGGCNADIFNWKDTIGPLAQRKELLNYHNGTARGIPAFGVDEFLRFCQEEAITPIITTAFLKDLPRNIDLETHPRAGTLKYVAPYLKTAPPRIALAADWVEYCNGSVDTPLGRLRAGNGHRQPYNVKYWEIGNESYGPDRVGSCTAEEYAGAFPAYVKSMKARDPSIKIALNGCGSRPEWNDTLLRMAGKQADLFQIHIYRTPHISNYTDLEGRPRDVARCMCLANNIPPGLKELEEQMTRHLGRTIPVVVTEFGMGNANNREFMTSITSAVLVADMFRVLAESRLVLGANKWCLYSGYWFSQVEGPTLRRPDAPYYIRPEQIMHEIYARCRHATRLSVNNDRNDSVKAIVFQRDRTYGAVLISRESVGWQSITLDLAGSKAGKGTCIAVTAGHPFLGNEADHNLVRKIEFSFNYTPGTPIRLPSNSVVGLIVPR